MVGYPVASYPPRLALGSTVAERFRVVAYLGQGSTGSVYRAEPLEKNSSAVALKLVRLDILPDGRDARRFERAVESGLRIQSPHVARTLSSGRLDETTAWLALELVEGPTLEELVLARGALPRDSARVLLSQLFAALMAAHAEGVVHRDLNPSNVRVAEHDGAAELKLLDFGVAKEFGDTTFSGTTPGLGAPLWTAPEQGRRGYRPVPSADVWALGLLSFFVLSGKRYWLQAREQASLADLALELLRGEIVPPSVRARQLGSRAELPSGFDAWFARAVSRDPAARFADAAAAWNELQPVLEQPAGATAAAAARLAKGERPSLVARPALVLLAVLLSVTAAGLTLYWLLRSMRV